MVNSASQSPVSTSIGPPWTISRAADGRSPKKPGAVGDPDGPASSRPPASLLGCARSATSRSPSSTRSPTPKRTCSTTPGAAAMILCSIFIASTTIRQSPSPTPVARADVKGDNGSGRRAARAAATLVGVVVPGTSARAAMSAPAGDEVWAVAPSSASMT